MWTQIRLLLQEQSDLGPDCLLKESSKIFQQMTTADNFFCDWHFKGYGKYLCDLTSIFR